MPQVILISADYVDWPLWRPIGGPVGGPVGEDELPLSEPTRQRIRAWHNHELRRPDWPTWTEPDGMSDHEVEQAWIDEGVAIRDLVQAELGADYLIFYEP